MPPPFETRPARPEDHETARAIHHSAYRALVERNWSWDEAAQDRMFESEYETLRATIVLVGGIPVGTFQVEHRDRELWLLDIAISKEHQGRGLGSAVIRQVIADAHSRGETVKLGVLDVNEAAQRLYRRLGFGENHRVGNSVIMSARPRRPRGPWT